MISSLSFPSSENVLTSFHSRKFFFFFLVVKFFTGNSFLPALETGCLLPCPLRRVWWDIRSLLIILTLVRSCHLLLLSGCLSFYCQNSDCDGSCPKFLWVYYHMGFGRLLKSVALFFFPKLWKFQPLFLWVLCNPCLLSVLVLLREETEERDGKTETHYRAQAGLECLMILLSLLRSGIACTAPPG